LCSQNGDATCGSWDSQGVQNLCPKQLLKKENYILFEELRHKLPKIFSTTHMFIGGQIKFDWILTKPLKTFNKICKGGAFAFYIYYFFGTHELP